MRTTALTRLSDRLTEVTGSKSNRQTKFDAGRVTRHDSLTTERTKRDANRQARYEKLRSRASTTAQTTSVNTFATEVERLITVRKAAEDTAIKTFEDAVLVLETTNDTAATSLSTTMKADINKIFDDASASCTAGKTGPEVMSQVKAAMESQKTARASDAKAHVASGQFTALQAARKASVDAAMANFKTGMDAATVDLKKAFAK